MAKFDPYIRNVFDKMYNDNFIADIQSILNEILPLLINGDISIFKNNEQNNELLSSLKLQETHLLNSLTRNEITNGVRNKVGFNNLTIMSEFLGHDVRQFLNDVPSDFTQMSIQLNQINAGFKHNLRYFQCINQIIQKYKSLLIDVSKDDNIQYNFFKYLFNRIHDRTDYGYNSFIYVYSFLLLYSAYSKLTAYQTSVYYSLKDNNRLTPVQIGNDFSLYYTNHKNDIITSLEKYCYRNLFNYSNNYTTLFDTKVDVKLDTSLTNLVSIFNDNISEFTNGNQFLNKLLTNCVEQLSYYTTWYRINEDQSSFYEYINHIFNVDVFETYLLQEDLIYEEIKNHVIDNIIDLENAEYVAWQFNNTPLYFINSYTIIHYQYASNLVDSMRVPFNVSYLFNKINYRSDRNTKMRDYLTANPFIMNDSVVKRCSLYSFSDLISNFMDSDYVTQWIIHDFFPSLLSAININYYQKLDFYKYVDDIRWVLKLIFINDIFNDNLFNYLNEELTNYISARINDNFSSESLSDVTMDLIFSGFPKVQLEKILNGIYKSAYVNNYLNNLTSKYSL